MYCRVIRLKGDPSKTEEAIKGWINGLLPALKQQPGFAGATLAGNRTTGEGLGVSYFESEKTMIDARDRVRPEAMKVMDAVGSTIVEEDTCEVAVSERFKPAKSGAFVRVTTVQADPAHIAEGIKYFQEKVVPSSAPSRVSEAPFHSSTESPARPSPGLGGTARRTWTTASRRFVICARTR